MKRSELKLPSLSIRISPSFSNKQTDLKFTLNVYNLRVQEIRTFAISIISSIDSSTRGFAIQPTMKVTIKEWNAVASWRWDMPEDDVCGICRVQFDGTCPTCKFPGDDCTLRKWTSDLALEMTSVLNTLLSNREVWPLLPYGTNQLKHARHYSVLIFHSIACSPGFSKIPLRAYVQCAGRVRVDFAPEKNSLIAFTRI